MNIKLDDDIYKTFVNAAETVSKNGIKVSVPQLAETIINAELSGMDSKKIAKRFLKSLMSQLASASPETDKEEEEEYADEKHY